MNFPTLKTTRLILTPISLDDAPFIQKYFNNWNIIQHLSTAVPWPYPENGAEDFIKNIALPRIQKEGHFIWSIKLREKQNEAVGLIDFGIERSNHGDRGFWIAEHLHGRGLMSEACAAVNDFLFFDIDLHEFTVVNAISNIASRRVKEKTSAKFISHGSLEHNNGETKTEIWRVTKDNWLAAKS